MSSLLADVLSRLQATPKSGQWWARCPCHHERSSSLSIRAMPDGFGLACHCFGCGAGTNRVLTALGLAGTPSDAIGPVPLPAEPPEQGSAAWWHAVHLEALDMARRQSWYDPELEHWRRRIVDLQEAASSLGPDDPAAWIMVDAATDLELAFRHLEVDVLWSRAGAR